MLTMTGMYNMAKVGIERLRLIVSLWQASELQVQASVTVPVLLLNILHCFWPSLYQFTYPCLRNDGQ